MQVQKKKVHKSKSQKDKGKKEISPSTHSTPLRAGFAQDEVSDLRLEINRRTRYDGRLTNKREYNIICGGNDEREIRLNNYY
jgi:hypothetical protein